MKRKVYKINSIIDLLAIASAIRLRKINVHGQYESKKQWLYKVRIILVLAIMSTSINATTEVYRTIVEKPK